jgi:hypothetical protein
MTVSTTQSRIGYNGNGATTVFAFPYRFLANTDLVVTLVRADTTQVVQTLNTDYTVMGAGDDAGGTVTMVVAPATGQQLIIVRAVPLTQETDYISGDPFPAETHERALDKLTMISQRLESLISRSIRLSDADLLVTSTILPPPSPGSSLIWNLTGTAIVNGVPIDGTLAISPYMEVVLGSVDAAEALTNLTAAADAAVVKLTGAQTVAGVKTFSDKPIIPDGTAAQNPVSKAQLDAVAATVVPSTLAPTLNVLAASQALNGLTSVLFSGIPSWVTCIRGSIVSASIADTAVPIITLGDSGGLETSGYVGAVVGGSSGASPVVSNLSAAFQLKQSSLAAQVWHSQFTLLKEGGSRWSLQSMTMNETGVWNVAAGSKTLSGELTQLEVGVSGGAGGYDAGTCSIVWS